ncbi:PH domain-containing protein [Tumebacillus lipolyticus]|uniref:PH domain-containing protein n=1 Tax=Tumebacillus lipolyticus TaxID=1280370 RepID=A0ABW4ZUA2_9BACL
MKFVSKKDWWLTLLIWGTMLLLIGSGIFTLATEQVSTAEVLFLTMVTILLPLFFLLLWFTTYYVVEEENLVIRFSFFKKTVPLAEIRSVKKTSNPLSSPALSLKRLEIRYGRYGSVLISPLDRDEFIKMLKKRCPQVEINL